MVGPDADGERGLATAGMSVATLYRQLGPKTDAERLAAATKKGEARDWLMFDVRWCWRTPTRPLAGTRSRSSAWPS